MNTSRQDIQRWLDEGLDMPSVTHMLVISKLLYHDDYPVYVTDDQLCQAVFEEYDNKNMQKVMEIYDLGGDLVEQLAAERAWCT